MYMYLFILKFFWWVKRLFDKYHPLCVTTKWPLDANLRSLYKRANNNDKKHLGFILDVWMMTIALMHMYMHIATLLHTKCNERTSAPRYNNRRSWLIGNINRISNVACIDVCKAKDSQFDYIFYFILFRFIFYLQFNKVLHSIMVWDNGMKMLE